MMNSNKNMNEEASSDLLEVSFIEPIEIFITKEESTKEYIGVRLDKFLVSFLSEYSRSYLQKLIDSECVTINDNIKKSNYKLKLNDKITIKIPEPEEINIEPENIPLDILYEDEYLLIVNKPKNMVVHPAPGHYSGTLVNALMYHCKDCLSSINGVLRPGIVHRIDMDTTGLLVICKNDVAHRVLSEKFKVHDITRVYTAIVYNHFKEEEGTIDQPIARHPIDRKKMAIIPNGRRAVTHYKVIEQLNNNFSLVECRLETGRTHQIRVHMASIHHPLLGDEVYGPIQHKFNTNGQVLHAGVLGFEHPITQEYMEFEAPLPEYFEKILNQLRT